MHAVDGMASRCAACDRVDETVEGRSVLCVVSLVFRSESWTVDGRWCERCFRRQAAKYSALTLLFGPWSLTGPFRTLYALYSNIVRRGYQAHEQNWAVRRWNAEYRWTSAGRFLRSGRYGLVVVALHYSIFAAILAANIEVAPRPLLAATIWFAAGAGLSFGYLLFRRRQKGEFFSGGEIEQLVIFEIVGIALGAVGDAAAAPVMAVFLGVPTPALLILFRLAWWRVPVRCECLDEACHMPMSLSATEYALVSDEPGFFAVVPGHEAAATDTVRARTNRYLIVEERTDEPASATQRRGSACPLRRGPLNFGHRPPPVSV